MTICISIPPSVFLFPLSGSPPFPSSASSLSTSQSVFSFRFQESASVDLVPPPFSLFASAFSTLSLDFLFPSPLSCSRFLASLSPIHPLKFPPPSMHSSLSSFIVSSTRLAVVFISLLETVIIFHHSLPIWTFLFLHPSSSPLSCRFSSIPNFTPIIIPPTALLFFFFFLPIALPICTLSVVPFLFFSSSVPQPNFPPDPLSRIVVRSPKILPLFCLVPLRYLSYLLSCVPLCASFPVSLFFVHFHCLRFLHPIFLPLLKKL
jgi:hypothetical protein